MAFRSWFGLLLWAGVAAAAPASSQTAPVAVQVRGFSTQREVAPRQVEHRNWYTIVLTPGPGDTFVENVNGRERRGTFGEEHVSGPSKTLWLRSGDGEVVRIVEFPAHIATTRIALKDGLSCKATMEITRKPGHTLFEGVRSSNGERMLMDRMLMEQVTCSLVRSPADIRRVT